jgi:hypothetical protein
LNKAIWGDLNWGRALEGVLLMRYIACVKQWSQNFKGIEVCDNMVNPISTICLCFLSIVPCWCEVWGQVSLWIMPKSLRREVNGRNSPPQSDCIDLTETLNWV